MTDKNIKNLGPRAGIGRPTLDRGSPGRPQEALPGIHRSAGIGSPHPTLDHPNSTSRIAGHHADRPKLQRLWGMPPPLHEAYRLAHAAKRPITTLLVAHATAADAASLAAKYPNRSVFALRSEPFDDSITLPAGHLVTYHGNWFYALEGLLPAGQNFGSQQQIILLPGFSTNRTVRPYERLRALLALHGRLNALVKTRTEADLIAAEFRTAFTKANSEVVHVFGFAYFDGDTMLTMNPQTGNAEAVDSEDIQTVGTAHFPPASEGEDSPYYWVMATRTNRQP